MDFLRKHLEKLLLGLVLVALLASIVLLLRSLTKTRTAVAQMAREVQEAANGGNDIKLFDPEEGPDVNAVLTDPNVKFETLPSMVAAKSGKLWLAFQTFHNGSADSACYGMEGSGWQRMPDPAATPDGSSTTSSGA